MYARTVCGSQVPVEMDTSATVGDLIRAGAKALGWSPMGLSISTADQWLSPDCSLADSGIGQESSVCLGRPALCGTEDTPRMRLTGHTKPVTCCAISEDGSTVLTGGQDGTGRLWYAGKQVKVHKHGSSVVSCDMSHRASPDRILFASGGVDKTAQVWGPSGSSGEDATVVSWAQPGTVKCVRFSTSQRIAVAARGRKDVAIYNTESVRGLESALACPETDAIDFHPQKDAVVCTLGGGCSPRLRMWDLRAGAGRETCSFNLMPSDGGNSYLMRAHFVANGVQVVTCVPSNDAPVCLWDIRNPGRCQLALGREEATYDAVASLDGTTIFGATKTGRLSTWDSVSGEVLSSTLAHTGSQTRPGPKQVWCLAASKNAVVTGGHDYQAAVWNIKQSPFVLTQQDDE